MAQPLRGFLMSNQVPIQTIVAKRMLSRLQNKLPMTATVNKDFQDDLKDSEKLDSEKWFARKWYQELPEKIARLFSPVL